MTEVERRDGPAAASDWSTTYARLCVAVQPYALRVGGV